LVEHAKPCGRVEAIEENFGTNGGHVIGNGNDFGLERGSSHPSTI
jgi:hypothetical protein